MILDTYSEVFVWIGRGANEIEKKEGLKTAQEYVKTDPSDRDLDSISLIQASLIVHYYNSTFMQCYHFSGEARLRATNIYLPLLGLESKPVGSGQIL